MQHENFYVVGISYKNADVDTRGMFSLRSESIHALMDDAKKQALQDFLVINTCNRTELLGWATQPETFITLLCTHTKGDTDTFKQLGICIGKRAGLETYL